MAVDEKYLNPYSSLEFPYTPHMRTSTLFWALTCCLLPALGNVEKTIFLAPPSISIPSGHPNLNDLYLDVLSAPLSQLSLRRQVPASFPTPTDPRGNETWLLLEGLQEGRRYEVRICWLATVRARVIIAKWKDLVLIWVLLIVRNSNRHPFS